MTVIKSERFSMDFVMNMVETVDSEIRCRVYSLEKDSISFSQFIKRHRFVK